jgi:hypothetical protein
MRLTVFYFFAGKHDFIDFGASSSLWMFYHWVLSSGTKDIYYCSGVGFFFLLLIFLKKLEQLIKNIKLIAQ